MFALIFLYLILPAIQLAFYLQEQTLLSVGPVLNGTASIFGFHWLFANIIVAAKIPWLQKRLPYDMRIRFHILASMGLMIAIAYHAIFKIASGREIDILSWILLAIMVLFIGLALLWVPIPGAVTLQQRVLALFHRTKLFSYDTSKSIHKILSFALIPIVILHVAITDLFSDLPLISTLAYLALFGIALVLTLLPKTGIFRTWAKVLSIKLQNDIVIIEFMPEKPYQYKSGQFFFLRVKLKTGHKEEHPFSFLSSPEEPQLSLAARAVGDFTQELKTLQPGSRIAISGGFGSFGPRTEPAICFIASGIGIVPFLSTLKDLHAHHDPRPIYFYLAVNALNEIPEYEKLQQIASSMPNLQLRILVPSVDGLRYSTEYFRSTLPNPEKFVYYLCSSPKVRDGVIHSLRELGISRQAIHYENFTLS